MLNQAILIGYICNDLELQYAGNEKTYLRFTLAVNRGGDKGTDFIDCTCFGKTAENTAKYQGKGSLVGVAGRIQTNTVEYGGQKRKYTGVVANRVVFLQQPKDNGQAGPGAKEIDFDPDDVPFF